MHRMMDPTKRFKDIKEYSPYLETCNGKRYCYYCGWVYTFGTQCDCLNYDDDDDVVMIDS